MRVRGVVHVHSSYSHDGRDSLPALQAFARQKELAFVALTDHAEDFDPEVFRRFTEECRSLSSDGPTLIPGLEFRFKSLKGLHLLALGLTRWIEPETVDDFISMTDGVAGLTVAAHPVLPNYTYPGVVLDGIGAIEVWNASYNTRFLPDPRAIRLVHRIRRSRPAVVAIAGLDQHDARNDRETRVELLEDGDPLACMRDGRFVNVGRTMRFDSGANLGPVAMAGLSGARLVLNGVEGVQDRVARWLARRGP